MTPSLGCPLDVAWKVETGDFPDHVPIRIGDRVIVASGGRLVAIRIEEGSLSWSRELPSRVVNLVEAGGLACISYDGELGRTVLEAVEPGGRTVWRIEDDWSAGHRALQGAGEYLLALGIRIGPHHGQTCKVIRASDGAVLYDLPVHGWSPVLAKVPEGELLVFGCSQGKRRDDTGLFTVDFTGKRRRVHGSPVSFLVVHDGVVLASNDTERFAVRLVDERELWRAEGGPITDIPCDGGQAALVRRLPEERVALGLYDVVTGKLQWETEPLGALVISSTIAADAVVVSADCAEVRVYRRADGAPLQTFTFGSGVAPLATHFGLVCTDGTEVYCLHARSPKPRG